MIESNQLDPEFQNKVNQMMTRLTMVTGLQWRIVQGKRTIAYQDALYAQGRTAPGKIVTNAKGGSSPHNYGMAVDVVPFRNGKPWWDAPRHVWNALGTIVGELGLTWGGNFTKLDDKPHVESPYWRVARAKYLGKSVLSAIKGVFGKSTPQVVTQAVNAVPELDILGHIEMTVTEMVRKGGGI